MYAVLGDVEFELITYFDGMEAQFGVDYAEHPLIGGKPRLQWVGDKLDEFNLDLTFHASYCNPETELLKLRTAMLSRQARQFVLGSGTYKGWFVITDLRATSRQTDKAGGLIALDATVTLREYVDPKSEEARNAQAKKEAAEARAGAPQKTVAEADGAATLPPVAVPKPPSLLTTLASAVADAKTAALALYTSVKDAASEAVGPELAAVTAEAKAAVQGVNELGAAIGLPNGSARDIISLARTTSDDLRRVGLSAAASATGLPQVMSSARDTVTAANSLSRVTTLQSYLAGGGTRG